ncbi:sensor domain-containing diguanylate cyclase [Ferrimonas senticii]|uniref:sensor domain-containing diguanylate cyclase n=1 Tax=Ferrimonas senticii TaxID=394566 RepID=UPI00040ABB73|nr:diguanylate cyclase [Ferrimonas senticii]
MPLLEHRTIRNAWLTTIAVALVFNLGMVASMFYLKQESEQRLAAILHSLVTTNREALEMWVDDELATARAYVDNRPFLPSMLQQWQQQTSQSGDNLIKHSLDGMLRNHHYLGYFLLDRNFSPVLSHQQRQFDRSRFSSLFEQANLTQLIQGKVLFLHSLTLNDNGRPLLYLALGLIDAQQQLQGYLLFMLDPTLQFSQVLRLALLGDAGESFAFNQHGVLLSQRRKQHSDNYTWQSSSLNDIYGIDNADPNWRCRMLIDQQVRINASGYPDQHGTRVIGGWTWSSKLDLGIATEINFNKAYAAATHTQHILLGYLAFTNLLLLIIAFGHWRAQRQIRRQAQLDPLTGIANRRAFDEWMRRALVNQRRHQQPLTLMMIDVDKFKPYNDQFGHAQGDWALQQVAQALAQALPRATDMVARYGGEEFVVALQYTDGKQVQALAARLLAAVEQLQIHPSSAASHPVVTISIGGAEYRPQMQLTAVQLVHLADQALYRVKADGGNGFLLAN